MAYLVLAGILGIVFLICLLAHLGTKSDPDLSRGWGWTAVAFAAIFAILTVAMSITTVGARSVGIQTAFGRYSDTLSNGLQLVAPWSSVETFSTQVQYLDLEGDNDNVQVTFKGGGGGAVDATPRWRINPDKAEDLWKKYKTFSNVNDKLVNSSAKDSIRVITSQYTPNEARDGKNLRQIADEVQTDLVKTLADDGIVIDSISVKKVTLDQRSQESLDKVVAANNDIERAKAELERARIDGETVRLREREGNLKPEALTRYCLEVVNNWNVDRNGPMPAGFNCSGSDVPFVVTGK